jgi:GT2 family glycosyltransferase
MSSHSSGPSSIAVVAILADGTTAWDHTLEAAVAQSYEPAATYVVGGGAEATAAALGVQWEKSIQSLLAKLEPIVTHVWLLAAGAVPRPDALYALIFESERVGAGVAGSKLLELKNADRLVSVGMATDVFGVPYLGLDEDELDAGQYDVVRDVAAIAGDSVLVRRDLAKGLGGLDPLMAPRAAAIDLSQRSRVLGARVVVVPSSEVAVPEQPKASHWREEAGRIRSMIKVYSPLTLFWALPLRFLIGLLESLLTPFVGRWTLLTWLRSWIWNLARLPSTIRARALVQAGAQAGDAELFRFQLRGSAALKTLWTELVDAARARFPAEEHTGLTSLAREIRRPAFGVGLAALLFSLIATRVLWSGFPAAGFSLPLPTRGADAVAAYAGGWNPAGFGSTEQLPPFLGVAGLWQQLVFDRADLAAGSLVLAGFIVGIWGTTRLLRTWSVDSVPGILAGMALMAGPAARGIAGTGEVAGLIGLAVVPWVMRVAVAPWPSTWSRRLGRVLAAGWSAALLGNLSPELLALPAAALVIRSFIELRDKRAWLAALVAAAGTAIALPLLRPWITAVDLGAYLQAGDAFWVPGTVLLVAVLVAAVAAIVAAPEGLWRLGLWGALVGAAGGAVARAASQGGGRHVEIMGLAAVALGTALAAGATLEALRRIDAVTGIRRAVVAVGALGAAVVVASSLLVLAPGRGGLPSDDLLAALRFTSVSTDDSSTARVLLVGPPESLPGTSRRVRGAAYRVISAPVPQLWELQLPEPGPADEALEAVLEGVIDGEAFRAGEQLADFGIRWILAMGDTPLSTSFVGQLDLVPLDGLRRPAFLVDSADAMRALTIDGTPWRWLGTAYEGEPAPEVVVRETAHPRWGSDREPSPGNDGDPNDWAMTLDGSSGSIAFSPGPERREARLSLWGGIGLAAASTIFRRRW